MKPRFSWGKFREIGKTELVALHAILLRCIARGKGITLSGSLILSGSARAQLEPPTYDQSIHHLFNSNQGGVNNYVSFVRPLQQQRQR